MDTCVCICGGWVGLMLVSLVVMVVLLRRAPYGEETPGVGLVIEPQKRR